MNISYENAFCAVLSEYITIEFTENDLAKLVQEGVGDGSCSVEDEASSITALLIKLIESNMSSTYLDDCWTGELVFESVNNIMAALERKSENA